MILTATKNPKKDQETNNSGTRPSQRAAAAERVVLVSLPFSRDSREDDSAEFRRLAESAGAQVCAILFARRRRIDASTYVGTGKVEEIRQLVAREDASLVLVNQDLTPVQERNLEKALGCRVLDRTGLILDIFAQRARSHEGKLQVELAQLEHLATRLVRGWTHLERQKGGIGLRGPGETQLETDRRLLRARLRKLHQRLEKVRTQRAIRRKARHKVPIATVSLVGYTNAGKSSLFNRLTQAGVFVADQLFATLDPTMRRIELSGNTSVIVADTVGFIRHLPHDLIEAFKATLEEVVAADLLLHVVDASSADRRDAMERVQQVLDQIQAENVPQIVVFNKIDVTEQTPRIERDASGAIVKVWMSAKTGDGTELLLRALSQHFRRRRLRRQLVLPPCAGRLRAQVHEHLHVVHERSTQAGGWLLDVAMEPAQFEWLQKQDGFLPEYWTCDSAIVLAPTGS
ncbi:MAG: GTPase HflX [Gammaproteobacteria bacterium]|nr:MAG: GTPase HflX [Gammaproteobacteria bacterium]